MAVKLKILVVEDSQIQREKIVREFRDFLGSRKRSVEFLEADGIESAERHIQNSVIDAIVLDYDLGGPAGSKVYSDIILESLYENKHISLYILLHSGVEQDKFSAIEDKVEGAGFGYGFCSKNSTSYEMKLAYRQMMKWFERERHLPYPLESTLSKIGVADGPEKISKMINFVEVSVRYLSFIFAADLGYRTQSSSCKPVEFKNYTFGQCFDVLKKLSKANSAPFISELDLSGQGNHALSTLINKVLKLRNSVDHTLSEPDAESKKLLAKDYENDFKRIKEELYFLSYYPLILINNRDENEDKEFEHELKYGSLDKYKPEYIFQSTSLMGPHIPNPYPTFSSKEKMQKGKLYLMNWRQEALPLYPFIRFEFWEKTRKREFLMVDGAGKNGNSEYVSYQSLSSASLPDDQQFTCHESSQRLLTLLGMPTRNA